MVVVGDEREHEIEIADCEIAIAVHVETTLLVAVSKPARKAAP
jgi:hypothetical protein